MFDLATHTPVIHDIATLGQAIDQFLLHLHAAGRSPQTIKSYRLRFRRLLAYPEFMEWQPLTAVTPEMLDRYGADLREADLSDASRLAYIQTAKTFFSFCHRRGYISRDPGVDLERPKLNHDARNRVMARQDLYRLLDLASAQARRGNPRNLAILMFMADTGCRRGELTSLTMRNLRLDDLEATVTGKTGSRAVDYTDKTANVMRSWLDVRPDVPHDFVFIGQGQKNDGQPLLPGALNSLFKRMGKRAGVQGRCNPQAVRHLVGQSWTDAVNLELVRMKLGHASITTTAMFYTHQDMTRVKAATALHSVINSYTEEGS